MTCDGVTVCKWVRVYLRTLWCARFFFLRA